MIIDPTKPENYKLRNGYPVLGIYKNPESWLVVFEGDGLIRPAIFSLSGSANSISSDETYDLIERQPYEDFKRDDPVMVRNDPNGKWMPRYFNDVVDGVARCFELGSTSWSNDMYSTAWKFCRRPTKEEM